MKLKLIEPLRLLFKDEGNFPGNRSSAIRLTFRQVRELGTKLGIPEHLVWRHPFPGPGLGIRILGEVNEDQLRIARQADYIFIQEIREKNLYRQISQAFAYVTLSDHSLPYLDCFQSRETCCKSTLPHKQDSQLLPLK